MPTNEERARAARKGLAYILLSILMGLLLSIGFTNKYIPESNMFVDLFLWYAFSVVSRKIVNWIFSAEIAKIRQIVLAPESNE